jgi:prepilin-type N-terminal cleavage/methylation domain-containing protein
MKTTNLVRSIARFWPGKTSAPARFGPGQTDPPAAPPRRGYTLIELVGALALMAIIAAMVTPVVVNQTEIAAVNAETTSLATLNTALVYQVQHNFQIPSATNWAATLGQWLGMPISSVATNANGFQRIYVYDTNGFGSFTLPYTQTTGLTSLPASIRLMLVTSMSTNVPDASGPLSTTEFNAVWNTMPGNIPATWTTNWHGNAGDLLIQRVNLLPLFNHVVLSAVDTNVFGNFVVQSGTNYSAPVYVLTNSPSANWYFQGTVLALYDTNGPASWISSTTIYTNTSAIQTSQTYITCQKSFKTCSTDSNDYNASYHGDSCQAVSDCFDSFILHYNSWCNQGFATGGNSACNQLNQDLNQMNNITYNMCQ